MQDQRSEKPINFEAEHTPVEDEGSMLIAHCFARTVLTLLCRAHVFEEACIILASGIRLLRLLRHNPGLCR